MAEQKKQPNAYRAIFDEVLDFYRTDVSQIPNLDGAHFMSLGEGRNTCDYLPDQKYLHFFPDKEAAVGYGEDLVRETGKPVSVVAFYFDEEVLRHCTFTGTYTSADYRRQIKQEEYIIPLELFDAKENMLDVVAKPEKPVYDPDGYMSGFFF